MRAVVSLLLLLALAAPAGATTYVVDPAGSDGNAGSAVAPWQHWKKFVQALNSGAIRPSDTVLFRSGRYAACEGSGNTIEPLLGPGGAVGQPVTIKIDTSGPAGDVEVHGGAKGGTCGLTAWQQARKCVGGYDGAACDTNTECNGSGVSGGVCTDMPGVFFTTMSNDGDYWGGMAPGAIYQPALTPGGAPKIYERLWAPPTAMLTMPVFTPGHAQFLPYATLPTPFNYCGSQGNSPCNACTADRTPWLCCTGFNSGTCNKARIYAQTETGESPATYADPGFGPVEVPVANTLLLQNDYYATRPAPLQYVTFTNDGNGRRFHFRWAISNILVLGNADHVTFEDSEFGYNSRNGAFNSITYANRPNAARFPNYTGGETYLITGWPNWGSNRVIDIAFRRYQVHGSFANEAMHFIGGPMDRFNRITWEDGEVGDTPWAVLDGQSGTPFTQNANTNQVNKKWPPPGYENWTRFPTHWGPLGGGGPTDGQFITTSPGQVMRRNYFHDGGLMSTFEGGGSCDLVFEQNVVDFSRQYYAGMGSYPPMLISYCNTPTGCGGWGGNLSFSLATRCNWNGQHGAIVRNNEFLNGYGSMFRTGWFYNSCGEQIPPYRPTTPIIVANNTWHWKGDSREPAGVAPFWFNEPTRVDADCVTTHLTDWTLTSQSDEKLQWKNNILIREGASASGLPMLAIDTGPTNMWTQIDFDYNNWGGTDGKWRVGGTTYTSFAAWQAGIKGCVGCTSTNETHSVYADPQFVTPYTSLALKTTSPSYHTGTDLSGLAYGGFSTDLAGNARPAGLWNMGALQGAVYYVDPVGGNDANPGTLGQPWQTVPGTLAAGSGTTYRRTTWGTGPAAISAANPVRCGDMILLKGGTTHQGSVLGGGLCLAETKAGTPGACNGCGCGQGSFYTQTCSAANPITIRVATPAEWMGSTGPFTWDDAGATAAESPEYGPAQSATVMLSNTPGIVFGDAATDNPTGYGPAPTASAIILKNNPGEWGLAIEHTGYTLGKLDATISNIEVGPSAHNGIAVGEVSDAVIKNVRVHDAQGYGIDCGEWVHHRCVRVGVTNFDVYNNGLSESQFACDAIYVQGSESARFLHGRVHGNRCNGYNNGSGDHTYPYLSRTIVRDVLFDGNGTGTSPNLARAATEGGGDMIQSEVGAPTHGWCSTDALCPVDDGHGGGRGRICVPGQNCCWQASGNPPGFAYQCSLYDAYSAFEFVTYLGNRRTGAFAHHGSGFTWYNNVTLYGNNVNGDNQVGAVQTSKVAGDHAFTNAIIVKRTGTPLIHYDPGSWVVNQCRYNTPNAGQPCVLDSDCGQYQPPPIANTTTHACSVYLPQVTVKNSLLRPALGGANTEGMSAFDFKCDASCTGYAGVSCQADSDCGPNCNAGCNFDATAGATFAQALAGGAGKFLNDGTNLLGTAYDPGFVDVSNSACATGSDPTQCDVRLQNGSPAIDAGRFWMVTSAAQATPSVTLGVTGNIAARNSTLNFNGHGNEPASFFIPRGGFLGYDGDRIRIQGASCAAGNPSLPSDTAVAVAMTDSPPSITLDRACTWSLHAGVGLPWNGNAPDMGSQETTGSAPTTSTSVTTTSTSTSTSTSHTTSTLAGATTSTSTTSTSSTLPPLTNTDTIKGGVDAQGVGF